MCEMPPSRSPGILPPSFQQSFIVISGCPLPRFSHFRLTYARLGERLSPAVFGNFGEDSPC
jgi:hypothetical protein